MMIQRMAVVMVLLAILAAAAMAQPPQGYTLAQILVVHRHGARSPLVSVNASGVCPPYGCGVLNFPGKSMLFHLGLYLREHYNDTLQPYDFYDFRTFRSRSTDVGRTLQSAVSMIAGLFSHLLDTEQRAEPVISTKPLNQAAELLVWEGWPSIVFWQAVNTPAFMAYMSSLTLTIFSNATLQQIGVAQGLALECTPGTPGFNPFQCALDAQDVMNCAMSSGADVPAVVQQHAAQLDQVLAWYNSYAMWGYDSKFNGGKFVATMGTYGYLLAKDLIAKARAGGSVLEHYSGHDTTLMPLWMTLGNYSLINPAFAATMLFEAYVNTTSTAVNTTIVYLVAKLGNPGQLPANHDYTFEPYTLMCIAPNGQGYNSSAGCPLEDFERFINTRGPATPEGICYVPRDWLVLFDCAPSSPTFASNSVCVMYRQACLGACGVNASMTSSYACVL